ncbi:hypothetical protein AwDysgo_20130 [Bacteroidales bacterium]|nr:hypothetical protein AwDysgo_20130 [Bacteroidales bacterium]
MLLTVQRMFITGVSPLTMDDLTSGFKIGSNVTLEPQINDIIGFSEQELRTMLDYFKAEGKMPHTVAEIIETVAAANSISKNVLEVV